MKKNLLMLLLAMIGFHTIMPLSAQAQTVALKAIAK